MMIFTVWFEMSPNLREYLTFFFKDANILKALLEHLKDIGFTELKQGGICLSRFGNGGHSGFNPRLNLLGHCTLPSTSSIRARKQRSCSNLGVARWAS